MSLQKITIELPVDLITELREKGLLDKRDFLEQALRDGLHQQHAKAKLTDEEMLAAIDEDFGMLADTDFTMDDVIEMKREEARLEERKMNRFK